MSSHSRQTENPLAGDEELARLLPASTGEGIYGIDPKSERARFLLETSVPGLFVAGDVRHRSVKRVASAVGAGSIAVMYVHHYLSSA